MQKAMYHLESYIKEIFPTQFVSQSVSLLVLSLFAVFCQSIKSLVIPLSSKRQPITTVFMEKTSLLMEMYELSTNQSFYNNYHTTLSIGVSPLSCKNWSLTGLLNIFIMFFTELSQKCISVVLSLYFVLISSYLPHIL